MGREISEEELKKAKEKLACHIEPQTYSKGTQGGPDAGAAAGASSAAPVSQSDFIGPDGKVFLTRMTSAGG